MRPGLGWIAPRMVRGAAIGAGVLAMHAGINARLLRRPPGPPVAGASGHPKVSVLIPARDEAAQIGDCVRAVLDQRGIDLELLVLDDGSVDGTAQIARTAANGDPRLRVLTGAPLASGWLGKPHACQQLADAASAPIFAFLDADVRVARDGIARSVELLGAARLDLVSPYPRQIAVTRAERLIQPLLQWSWLTFLPLRGAESRWTPASMAAANGQLLVCDATAYRAAGGHAAVRAEVVEDVALARAFKRAGYRATVADGNDIATCRMYAGWPELRDGYTKSLWAAFGSPGGAVFATGLLTWLYLLPPVATVARLLGRRPVGAAGLGTVAGIAGRVIAARRTASPPADAVAHPLSIALLCGLTARSWRRRDTITWKGRTIRPAAATAPQAATAASAPTAPPTATTPPAP